MAYRSPGIYLKEAAEGRFVRAEAVPMSVTAFLGLAQRGPVHVPCRLTSFAQFRDVYGAFLPHAYLAHAVFGYFANGGRECYVNRVAPLADGGDPAGATRAGSPDRTIVVSTTSARRFPSAAPMNSSDSDAPEP